jgi:hypothetical protein
MSGGEHLCSKLRSGSRGRTSIIPVLPSGLRVLEGAHGNRENQVPTCDDVPMLLAIRELDSAVQYILVATTLIPEDAVFGANRAC